MFDRKRLISLFALTALAFSAAACSKKGPSSSSESTIRTESVAALKRIHFDFDKYSIRADAAPILRENANWMKANSNKQFIVEGHCDERGTNEYNMALGERRAKAAKDYLINLGVSASILSTVSFGEEKPLDFGHDESAWAANRRAEFVYRR